MHLNNGYKKDNKRKIISVFEEIFHRKITDNELKFSGDTV